MIDRKQKKTPYSSKKRLSMHARRSLDEQGIDSITGTRLGYMPVHEILAIK